jgi:cytochrome c-type biogenesis protein CcmH
MAFAASTHQTLDQHVQSIGKQLKCPVCQGESVADSTSDRAQEIRATIRQQILAGQSDQQIIQYFSDRYGTQIVWSPPWWGFSLLAWLVPVALLLSGLVLILFTLRDWRMSMTSVATQTVSQTQSEISDMTYEEATELATLDETELAQYRAQLERELATDDALFERPVQHGRRKQVNE